MGKKMFVCFGFFWKQRRLQPRRCVCECLVIECDINKLSSRRNHKVGSTSAASGVFLFALGQKLKQFFQDFLNLTMLSWHLSNLLDMDCPRDFVNVSFQSSWTDHPHSSGHRQHPEVPGVPRHGHPDHAALSPSHRGSEATASSHDDAGECFLRASHFKTSNQFFFF